MGMSQADPECIGTSDQIIRLWLHEMSRVFKDRLNCVEDNDWFDKNIQKIRDNFLPINENDFKLDCLFSDVLTR